MATNTPVNEEGQASRRRRSPPPFSKLKLPLLDLPSPETDTLIYLHPTAPSPPLRCSSQRLLATGSPVFAKLLGPTCQYRILRRKNLLKLGLPMGIKFVVDLSPPTEGEEAVDVVEKLWCPDEVLQWNSYLEGNYLEEEEIPPPPSPKYKMLPTWGVPEGPPLYVNGTIPSEESLDFVPDLMWGGHERMVREAEEKEREKEEEEREEREKKKSKPAYSPVRHTGAIERLLHILHGLDPQIHSTPMWYTLYKVALQLECTTAVQDHIISWLYGNQDFIERYPALVLQIAAEMKNVGLFRDTFAILVGKQLLGGVIVDTGMLVVDESVPPEAEPWRKGIVAARKSLQERLERLYSYIDSTAWLDNAHVIPEYKKITAHLTAVGTTPKLRELTAKLDSAIRADIKAHLNSLFAFSEDLDNPNWTKSWQKAVFDMMPGRNQIFSRMYWDQLSSCRREISFSPATTKALHEWEIGLEMQKQEGLWIPKVPRGIEAQSEGVAPVYTERMLDVRPLSILKSKSKGKDKEIFPASPAQTTPNPLDLEHKFRKASTTQCWRGIRDSLKLTKSSPSSSSKPPIFAANRPDFTLPPISPTRTTTRPTGLPGICEISNGATAPPTYEGPSPVDELPAYTEIASPGTAIKVDAEKVGEKRKSRGYTDNGLFWYGSDTDVEETEIPHKAEDRHCDKGMVGFPKAERIEIANPMRKRRCSVEREGDDDENITEASFCIEREDDTGGEPEMFKISGVYEDTEPEPQPTKRTDKGKGKTAKAHLESGGLLIAEELALTYSDEIGNIHDTDPVGSAFDEAMALAEAHSKRSSNISPEIAYWRSSNTRIFAAENAAFGPPTSWLDPEGSGMTVARLVNHDWSSYTVRPQSLVAPLHIPKQETPTLAAAASPSRTVWDANYEHLPFNVPQKLNTGQLWKECLVYLKAVGTEQLKVPISFEPVAAGDGLLLVCLRNDEWQFCPLWAGGMMDYSEAAFENPEPVNIVGNRIVELEVRGGLVEVQNGDGDGDGEGSIAGSYDDCATEMESVGSFSTGGFSSFGVISDFGDSESEAGTIAGDETRSETDTESVLASEVGSEVDESATEAGDSSDDDVDSDGFEEVSWEDDF